MIIVFTSNESGGLVQMAITITKELIQLGYSVKCFVPNIAQANIPVSVIHHIIRYKKAKVINPRNRCARSVATKILGFKPSFVWYLDNGTFTSQVGINLAGKVKQALVMHDAGTSHASYHVNFRQFLKKRVEKITSNICNNRIDWIITCSPSSMKVYCELYPSHSDKTYMLPLGPHLPEVDSLCPPEIVEDVDYNLFFGRIDKYKGIDNLLKSYSKWSGNRKVIIAGAGLLQPEDLEMVTNDARITMINRFIRDEEMVYLFKHARAVILPYKEATQSGVLPIAYMCGKPVVCSAVIGISQFVEDGITGFVCVDEEDYLKAYSKIEDEKSYSLLSVNAFAYYNNNLRWSANIKKMFLKLDIV